MSRGFITRVKDEDDAFARTVGGFQFDRFAKYRNFWQKDKPCVNNCTRESLDYCEKRERRKKKKK